MTARAPSPRMLSVYDGQTCCGFILRRREGAFEGFTADEQSIGLFEDEQAAAAAIWRAARGQA